MATAMPFALLKVPALFTAFYGSRAEFLNSANTPAYRRSTLHPADTFIELILLIRING
jgi:hypothetical protein